MADHRTRTRRPARLAAITAFSLAALATVSPSPAGAASAGPCAGAYPEAITHVVVIMMENKDETSIMQSPAAPYLNTLATECGQATSYHGVAHPSLPNYLTMTGGSTFGVTDDKPPAYHKIGAASVFGQLGAGWRSYQESMGVPCQKYGTSLYAPSTTPPRTTRR